MATTSNSQEKSSHDFFLTPQQQSLLFAALESNKQQPINPQLPGDKALTLSPASLQTSPIMDNSINGSSIHDTPYLQSMDAYEFGDSSFDMSFADDSQARMIGDLPASKSESPDQDSSDKRAHPDDEEEEGDGTGAKRRESSEKVGKKPGRKPLTSEPTSKRKAQNRAAQRAFRERKEKHLKDLEDKVAELQKASDDANNENKTLRARVEQMTSELNDYKNRMTLANTRSVSGGYKAPTGTTAPALNAGVGDVNFQFEFPKFGVLPGPTNYSAMKPTNVQPKSSSVSPLASLGANKPISPPMSNGQSKENSLSPQSNNNFKDEASSFSAFFDPAMARASMSTSRASLDSNSRWNQNGTTTSSPSASSQSNGGPSSSCGTSPEPYNQSPMGFKPVNTMTTIGEEQSSIGTGHTGVNHDSGLFAGIDPSSFDWLAQQHGGHFDPQLFGDYRDPQQNILAGNPFDDSFFNDALDADFFMPYNTAPSPNLQKKNNGGNLIDKIDAAKDADDDVQANPNKQIGCPDIWAKLQTCEKVQNGDFDLDGLCTELQKKAKCSGTGPVVSETDFQTVVDKWMGKDCANKA